MKTKYMYGESYILANYKILGKGMEEIQSIVNLSLIERIKDKTENEVKSGIFYYILLSKLTKLKGFNNRY
jgi:hypothetical protein